ncbi:MAG: hypothetical protein KGL18_02525 [Burkholderiales bacterium]|nr:hypothetical protein [Burkholderiales bacterium]MDE1926167.1 hypothetical protein [Burkholderiales bacterium]MDE2158054.1 hypothetical protein [Burkholderiales bacterium]MDE2501843.1 hypothetical protein [Burkholderiales bacterium]
MVDVSRRNALGRRTDAGGPEGLPVSNPDRGDDFVDDGRTDRAGHLRTLPQALASDRSAIGRPSVGQWPAITGP